jgi:phosphoribosylaminoimidazolecarboxamide formyltransferase/IMP cyclohydrolase
MSQIKRALISCTDKVGLVEFARFLAERGIEILSTGGTAKALREGGIPVKDVSECTGFPEMLDGRVKTLHPKIHGGLLGVRSNPRHQSQMREHGIAPIDLVVVNLYEFEKTVANPGCTLEEAVENIDIGGPSMLRSAAKNHRDVTVVADPADYPRVMGEIGESGSVSLKTRFELAAKAFAATARYDAAITRYLASKSDAILPHDATDPVWPETQNFAFIKVQDLRYGENPHQKASFYRDAGRPRYGLAAARQLQGKELSYNNILDAEAALSCCRDFEDRACVIVKHNNPCGAAVGAKLSEAFVEARACDPVSSFGGIVAMNGTIDAAAARIMAETFFEVILAPGFDAEALDVFKAKKNLRLLALSDFMDSASAGPELRCVSGGVLIQERDAKVMNVREGKVVTKREPTESEWLALDFAWRVAKHVKSNAIVFADDKRTLGIGAGQMSRVDSVRLAAMKSEEAFKNPKILKGSAMASDAFFPFRDGLDGAAKYGIAAVVQPGGSVRDDEVIEAANEHGIAMVFTGMRHFRH